MTLIQPRTLKGFRDYLPAMMIPRESMMQVAREVFRGYGFSPIDTPVLEYLEILTGKGSDETDRQIYRFQDNGGRDVGMRFDLTVPLARFAAQHSAQFGMPFSVTISRRFGEVRIHRQGDIESLSSAILTRSERSRYWRISRRLL